MRAFALICLIALSAGRASAEPVLHAALQAGLSSPSGRFDNAPSYGLAAGLQWDPRFGGELTVLRASHAVQSSSLSIHTTSLALGPMIEVDLLPVAPTLSLGPALQLASRSDGRGGLSLIPAGYVSVGLRTRFFEHLHAAAQLQYLTSAFGSDVFPAYTSFVVQVGGAIGL